jgi:hypothetical protein
MTDRNRVSWLLQAILTPSATATFTPASGGGSALVLSPPYKLRLMSAMPNGNISANTELTTFGGYTALGASMGSSAFGAPTNGVATNSNLVSWSATNTWATVVGIEIWDSAGTPLRWFQGAITSITGVVNGDTVQFAIGSCSIDASQW